MKGFAITVSLLLSLGGGARAQGALGQRVDELSRQIAAKMSAQQKTTVAVVEFTDLQGNVTDFGRFLAEELITRLYETEKFKVIERQLLTKIIAEQKLSLTGVVDPASAKQLGKLLGVDAVVTGTISNLAQNLRVNARIISATTGEIISVASAEIFKDESVTGLLAGGGSAPPAGKPVPQQTDPTKRNLRKVTVRDFTLELESCRRSAGQIICSLTITNDSTADRVVKFIGVSYGGVKSRMFDDLGGEYVVDDTHIGSLSSRVWGDGASNSLVPQVPMRLKLFFDSANPEAKMVTLLRVSFEWEGTKNLNLNADFRNVALAK